MGRAGALDARREARMARVGAIQPKIPGLPRPVVRCERCGLTRRSLSEARAMAARAAAGPAEVVRSMKATIQGNDAITRSEDAVAAELGPQLASLNGEAFVELLARLRAQIAAKS